MQISAIRADGSARTIPNLEHHLPDVEKQADLIYLTYFNAGVRIFDIKNPRAPKEVGWFMPPMPIKRHGPLPTDKLVSQTEDVVVDTRGNIYISDKQWGVLFCATRVPGNQSRRRNEVLTHTRGAVGRLRLVFMNADQPGTLF